MRNIDRRLGKIEERLGLAEAPLRVLTWDDGTGEVTVAVRGTEVLDRSADEKLDVFVERAAACFPKASIIWLTSAAGVTTMAAMLGYGGWSEAAPPAIEPPDAPPDEPPPPEREWYH